MNADDFVSSTWGIPLVAMICAVMWHDAGARRTSAFMISIAAVWAFAVMGLAIMRPT